MGEHPKFHPPPRVKRHHRHKHRHPQGHSQGITDVRRPEIKARLPLEISPHAAHPCACGRCSEACRRWAPQTNGSATLGTAVSKHPSQSRHGQMWPNFDKTVQPRWQRPALNAEQLVIGVVGVDAHLFGQRLQALLPRPPVLRRIERERPVHGGDPALHHLRMCPSNLWSERM